ncbi:hypothetical protein JYU34_018869 [Plutella xylostella]|uniref:Uncharacterized protein n=1 Tax=Plutella xylostella TaxID=51655 RepID=A0ABQ7PYP8_PLUXY|nr:hypothetical protein JYU34_018869 [Plutella xylostella]
MPLQPGPRSMQGVDPQVLLRPGDGRLPDLRVRRLRRRAQPLLHRRGMRENLHKRCSAGMLGGGRHGQGAVRGGTLEEVALQRAGQ